MFNVPGLTPRSELDKKLFEEKKPYQFEVINVEYGPAKTSGNTLLKLSLRFFTDTGVTHEIFDSIPLMHSMFWKVAHYCDSIGCSEMYDANNFILQEMLRKTGWAFIKYETYEGTERPKVKDYIKKELQKSLVSQPQPSAPPAVEAPFNDDIPWS